MSLYDKFLKIKNEEVEFDSKVDYVQDVARNAINHWDRFSKYIEIENKPISEQELRDSATAAVAAAEDVRYAMNHLFDAAWAICTWVVNNVGDRPVNDDMQHISVTLQPGEDFNLYEIPEENDFSLSTFNGYKLSLKQVHRPLQVFSVAEVFTIAEQTRRAAGLLNSEVFGRTNVRQMFDDELSQLRQLGVETVLSAPLIAKLSLDIANDPMGEHPEVDQWNETKYKYDPDKRSLLIFENIITWSKNVNDTIIAISNNTALFSEAIQAMDDDKFTM